MKIFHAIFVASLATATVLPLEKRAPALEVKLESIGNSEVKATITNTGSGVNLLKKGTFLDDAPVEKLELYQADSRIPFNGVRIRIADTNLTEAAFVPLASGQTIEVTVEMAALHDLTSGGDFDVVAQGAVPYALEGTTELTGDALSFLGKINVNVDGAKAALVPRAINLEKRTALQSGCSSSQRTATVNALANCQRLASSAASAASSGNAAKFNEYFKSTTTSVRNTVAARLRAVASECGSSSSGATRYYCTDVYSYCESNVLAYTLPSQNVVVNCPLYYSALPALTTTCHAQDQATTTLHEMTHAPGVYSPGTLDNGYGYAAATRLSSSQAVNNADSYALYSNAIYVGC